MTDHGASTTGAADPTPGRDPGGPADVRELPRLTIRKCAVSAMSNNAYLLTCRATGRPAAHRRRRRAPAPARPRPQGGDGPRGGRDDAPALGPRSRARRRRGGHRCPHHRRRTTPTPCPWRWTRRLEQGDTVTVGDVTLTVVHLRGHTPGSVALAYRDADDPAGARTSSPATASSPVASANTKHPGRASTSLHRRRHRPGVRRLRRRHVGVPRTRERHHPRGRAAAPRRVARPRLVALEVAPQRCWIGSRTRSRARPGLELHSVTSPSPAPVDGQTDAAGDVEAEPGALADVLGRVERLERAGDDLGRHPSPVSPTSTMTARRRRRVDRRSVPDPSIASTALSMRLVHTWLSSPA